MKKVIYTCITGEYDEIKEPAYMTPGWDYVCFTNNPKLQSNCWEVRQINMENPDHKDLDNTRLARRIKILPHLYVSEYDLSIWIDGNLGIATDLNEFVSLVFKEDTPLSLMNHSSRNCIYEEALQCIREKKDDPSVISSQISGYMKEGFPENFGMVQTGIEVRKHNDPDLISFNEKWFEEVRTKSKRDQLSFNYIVWKTDFKYIMFDYKVLFSPKFFPINMHKHGW